MSKSETTLTNRLVAEADDALFGYLDPGGYLDMSNRKAVRDVTTAVVRELAEFFGGMAPGCVVTAHGVSRFLGATADEIEKG